MDREIATARIDQDAAIDTTIDGTATTGTVSGLAVAPGAAIASGQLVCVVATPDA